MAEDPALQSQAASPASPIEEYERLVAQIEAIVTRLEAGDLPLAEALLEYERGIALIRLCNDVLDQAELRITELAAGMRIDSDVTPLRASPQRYVAPFGEDDRDQEDG